MLAERLDLIAHSLPGGKRKPGVVAFELTKIAAKVAELEAQVAMLEAREHGESRVIHECAAVRRKPCANCGSLMCCCYLRDVLDDEFCQ